MKTSRGSEALQMFKGEALGLKAMYGKCLLLQSRACLHVWQAQLDSCVKTVHLGPRRRLYNLAESWNLSHRKFCNIKVLLVVGGDG